MSSSTRTVAIDLTWAGVTVHADLLDGRAPATCAAVWELAGREVPLEACHAIFSGRELGMHVPVDVARDIEIFDGIPPENHSAFPAPGDVMYQFCPSRQFGGFEGDVYDISLCYGPDTRLLMPWGWSPANRFASVHYADRDTLAEVGSGMVRRGVEELVFRRT
ncbi:DUF3830 family protein [Pseudonocardia sp. N23]|uniref:DUF3830 family protein n=1 Tax=Pseudonocardia sp. N23 TaxID=1987376 RepID=UPI000BFE0C55|nr:DUF3830 family protein [Pseudonocardia sp. N23]GAY10882.1 hypothetical protein TOK_5366 [Pseudonocardia sp. N23]